MNVAIKKEDFRMEFNLDMALGRLHVNTIKKILKMLNWWENNEMREEVRKELTGMALQAKSEWEDASRKFQLEYKLENDRANKKLLSEVKKAKSNYERLLKYIDILEE